MTRPIGATMPMTMRITPAARVTKRLRTPLTRTMPMFSPLVTIKGVPKRPPSSDVRPSPADGAGRGAS